MKLSLSGFRGEIPRLAKEVLPDQHGESALNARLLSGRLEAWKNFQQVQTLCKSTPINTIYPLRDPASGTIEWLHWRDSELGSGAVNVDVAKSIIAGDTSGRVYLTGLDVPRWTDWSLATTGSGCPPIQTRPLGVVAPTVKPSVSGSVSTTSPIDVSDNFENEGGWTFVPTIDGGGESFRIARRLATGGNPNGRLQFVLGGGMQMAYAYRDFGVGASTTVTVEFDYRLDQRFSDSFPTENLWLPKQYQFFSVLLMCDQNGNGPRVGWEAQEPPPNSAVVGRNGTSWSQPGSVVSSQLTNALPPLSQWVRVKLIGSKQSGGSYSWRCIVTLGSTVIIDTTVTGLVARGGYVGLAIPDSISGHGVQVCSVDNLRVTASAPPLDASDDVTTSYVYTYVAQVGAGFEESAPSPPSDIIVRDDGTTVTITTPTSQPPGGYNIVAKRIYRAVTSATGTDYYFLVEIPLAQATYDDTTQDRILVLGDILQTTDWDLPPSDMRGILALPNGIMAGFRRNELCLSEQGYPHAWPVKYRLATDFDIVGIGAIDTMVVICTKGFPYIAAGNAPGSYTMMKLEVPQACVSKRSIAYIAGVGVLYASPDGLVAVSGPGRAQVVTSGLFTRKEWQALRPESIIATAHDNRYFGFYDTGSSMGGFMLDFSESRIGVTKFSFHARAVASDLLDDKLYLLLDYNASPGPPGSPAPNQATPDGRTLFAFDDYQSGPLSPLLPYVWRSKTFLPPYPVTFRYCRVVADSYQDLTLRLLEGGVPYASIEVQSSREFVLPSISSSDGASRFSFELYGTASIAAVHFGEDSSEIV